MKIVIVSFSYEKKFATEEELLESYYTTTGWAEALQRKGAEVIVISRFHRESSLQKNKVQYYFVKDDLDPTIRQRHLPLKFLKRISELDADVIHLHNLSLSLQTFLLRSMTGKKTAIIIQHHGGRSPGKIKRTFYNLLNSAADGFFFTSPEQGQQWFMKKKRFDKIMPVMEGSTFFDYANRIETLTARNCDNARIKTGMKGSPVFLWVGRMDNNKDPLTMLDGFKALLEKLPDASLYMIYSEDKLSGDVQKKINCSPLFKNKIFLLGQIPHEHIKEYYISADYFVLGSHSEGSGYALSEALRCGCIPVVTNIPSFRMMTNNGRLGALWEPGNKNSFDEAAIAVMSKDRHHESEACIDFFKKNLSFDAIAETAMNHYKVVSEYRE